MPRLAIGLLSAFALCGGCYDWAIGSAVVDAGDAGDATPPPGMDASVDVQVQDSHAPGDVTSEPEAAPPPDSAPSCATLQAAVDSDRLAAQACTGMAGDCLSSVMDQCGCTVYVAQASNAATASYNMAVQNLKQASCESCGTCPVPLAASCLPKTGPDGGLTTACQAQ
jgi:hypothetical protein